MLSLTEAQTSAFSADQYDLCYPLGVERHWWISARAAIVNSLVRDGNAAGDAALEIGCGNGATLVLLRQHGIDCRGVEIAPAVVRDDVKAFITPNCDAVDLPEGVRRGVKTILLLDVVEHVDDPDAFLRRIAAAFPALRRVVITVPARQEIWSNYDEFYGHHQRYKLGELRWLGEAQGWKTHRAGYAFRISYLPALLLAALKIPRQVEWAPPSTNFLVAAAHRTLAALTWLEWRMLPPGLFGTSAVAAFDVGARAKS